MQKPKSINELLKAGGKRLTALKAKTQGRSVALEQVRAALEPKLAQVVVSAGFDAGQLTLGVAGAAWAARLRYLTDTLRTQVGDAMGVEILTVRIKVVPPPHLSTILKPVPQPPPRKRSAHPSNSRR